MTINDDTDTVTSTTNTTLWDNLGKERMHSLQQTRQDAFESDLDQSGSDWDEPQA